LKSNNIILIKQKTCICNWYNQWGPH